MVQFRVLILSFVFILAQPSFAEVLFEGYAKIYVNGTHAGFLVNRYDYDAKKKEFKTISFMKLGESAGGVNESLTAVAKEDLTPVSYTYLSSTAKTSKQIEAKFTGNKMRATIVDNGKKREVTKTLPKGAFLSSFLAYVILKSKTGLTTNTKYDYKAVAEEEADLIDGSAEVKNQEETNGIKVFRILNDFKGDKFVSLVTEKGEVLSTRSTQQAISTEVVPLSSSATNGIQIPTAVISSLFGDVPLGVTNAISKKYQTNPKGFKSENQ